MFRSRLPRYSRSKSYPCVPLHHWLSELVSIRMGSLAGLSTKALLSGSPVCMHAEFLTSRLPSTCFLCHTMCSVCSVGFCYDIFGLMSFSAIFTVLHFHACYPSLITLVSPASFPFQVSPWGTPCPPRTRVVLSTPALSHPPLFQCFLHHRSLSGRLHYLAFCLGPFSQKHHHVFQLTCLQVTFLAIDDLAWPLTLIVVSPCGLSRYLLQFRRPSVPVPSLQGLTEVPKKHGPTHTSPNHSSSPGYSHKSREGFNLVPVPGGCNLRGGGLFRVPGCCPNKSELPPGACLHTRSI